MKANELMIGDYVKIQGIEQRVNKISMKMFCDFSGDDMGAVEPIPITEDILKVNGFGNNGNKLSYYVEDGDWLFTIHKIDDMLAISLADDYAVLKYVHELQHALRLCGLNELADNFMLKAKKE